MEWIWKLLLFLFIIIIFTTIEYLCYRSDIESTLYDHNDAFNHFDYIHNKLKHYKIKHWLMLDTLRTAVKNNDIHKATKEIIIGTHIEDLNPLLGLNELITKDGYKFVKSYVSGFHYKTMKNKTIWRVGVNIFYHNKDIGDIYFFTRFPDKILRRYDKENEINYWPSLFTIPEWFFDKLEIVDIRGREYPVPRHADILLDYWYGEKWRKTAVPKINNNTDLQFLLNFVKKKGENIKAISNRLQYTYPDDQANWINKHDKPI